jgi:hypothetical protein
MNADMPLSSRNRRQERFVERHQRRMKRSLNDYRWVIVLAVLMLMVLVSVELGRSMLYMQDVKQFAETIDRLKPEEVKARVEQYSHSLSDRNPLI